MFHRNAYTQYTSLYRGGSLLFLALASGTGNLRKLPVRKRTYLPQFLGGNLKHKTRVAKGKNNRFRTSPGVKCRKMLAITIPPK